LFTDVTLQFNGIFFNSFFSTTSKNVMSLLTSSGLLRHTNAVSLQGASAPVHTRISFKTTK